MSFATYITPQQNPFTAEYLDIFSTGFTHVMVPLYISWHSNLFGCFLTHHMICLQHLLRVCCSYMKMQRERSLFTLKLKVKNVQKSTWLYVSLVLNLTKHL